MGVFLISFLLPLTVLFIAGICYYCTLLNRRQKGRQVHRPAIFVTSVRAPNAPGYSSSPPTVYVTPMHHQPPPRYEASAPPSYDEVVGTHSPAAAQVRSQTTI